MPSIHTRSLLPEVATLLAAALALGNADLAAREAPEAGAIIPASPLAFEPVHLDLPTLGVEGDCARFVYMPEFNAVERAPEGLLVRVRTDFDVTPIPTPDRPCSRQWVQLGQLPAGEYRVDLVIEGAYVGQAEYHFTVITPAAGLMTTPAFDYSGFYWDPLESGSALQVIQTGKRNLGAALLTYDESGRQQWIMIGVGSWLSPGEYLGQALRTRNGHPISANAPSERVQAETEFIGTASIGFGGGLGIDPLSAVLRISGADGLLIERSYRRFEF
jgi:hypothetical protein